MEFSIKIFYDYYFQGCYVIFLIVIKTIVPNSTVSRTLDKKIQLHSLQNHQIFKRIFYAIFFCTSFFFCIIREKFYPPFKRLLVVILNLIRAGIMLILKLPNQYY